MIDYVGVKLRKAWCPTACPRCGAVTKIRKTKNSWRLTAWSWECYWTATHAIDDYFADPAVQEGLRKALAEASPVWDRIRESAGRWQGGQLMIPFGGKR